MKAARRTAAGIAALATVGGAGVVAARTVLKPKRDAEAKALLQSITHDASHERSGSRAATSTRDHGIAYLCNVLQPIDADAERTLQLAPDGIDIARLAAMAGAVFAASLPTVHQADTWHRQSSGAKLGERAAAAALAATGSSSLAGYAQAVARLEAYAMRCESTILPANSTLRSLVLHDNVEAAAADESDEYGVFGSVSHEGSLMRAWASVLFSASIRWAQVCTAAARLDRRGLNPPKVTLIAPALPSENAATEHSAPPTSVINLTRWMPYARRQFFGGGDGGFTVLLPLPMPPPTSWAVPSSCLVDVLLPSSGEVATTGTVRELLTEVRVRVPVGGALLVDARARWHIVEEEDGTAVQPQPACVIYEYYAAGTSQSAPGVSDGTSTAGGVLPASATLLGHALIALAFGPPAVLEPAHCSDTSGAPG